MFAGHRWRGCERCRAPDSLHLDPSVLLREWHQYPASEQHETSGRDPGGCETGRRVDGPTLCVSHRMCHFILLVSVYCSHAISSITAAELFMHIHINCQERISSTLWERHAWSSLKFNDPFRVSVMWNSSRSGAAVKLAALQSDLIAVLNFCGRL